MDNEPKTGAGRATEQASEDIDRRHRDEDATAGTGPEIVRKTPGAAHDETEDAHGKDAEEDADEDPGDDTEEDTDDDDDRGPTPV